MPIIITNHNYNKSFVAFLFDKKIVKNIEWNLVSPGWNGLSIYPQLGSPVAGGRPLTNVRLLSRPRTVSMYTSVRSSSTIQCVDIKIIL